MAARPASTFLENLDIAQKNVCVINLYKFSMFFDVFLSTLLHFFFTERNFARPPMRAGMANGGGTNG